MDHIVVYEENDLMRALLKEWLLTSLLANVQSTCLDSPVFRDPDRPVTDSLIISPIT